MPLHLPPHALSRRSFVSTLLATWSLNALGQNGSLSKDSSEPWALLSDTHIAADPNLEARGIRMAAHLRQAVTEILRSHVSQPFAGTLVNGDCAYLRGLQGDYQTFASLLEPLSEKGLPIHLTLGNHDDRNRFREGILQHLTSGTASPNRPLVDPAKIPDKLASRVSGRFCDWYLLDSLEITDQTPGIVGSQQLEWLEQQLDAAPQRNALVMVHHNPQPPGLPKVTGLRDTEALLALLLRKKQVKALFFGHTHVAKTVELGGLHLVNLPACAYRFHESQPTGWTHATLDATGCTLTLFDTAQSHTLHAKPIRLDWRTA